MNKGYKHRDIFSGWNNWNIIISRTINTSNDKNDDMVFGTILKEGETRISEKILSYIYGTMRINDERTDLYYVRNLEVNHTYYNKIYL